MFHTVLTNKAMSYKNIHADCVVFMCSLLSRDSRLKFKNRLLLDIHVSERESQWVEQLFRALVK